MCIAARAASATASIGTGRSVTSAHGVAAGDVDLTDLEQAASDGVSARVLWTASAEGSRTARVGSASISALGRAPVSAAVRALGSLVIADRNLVSQCE